MNAKYRIEICRSRHVKSWFWRLVHRNGQILATSELYAAKANAQKTAERFRAFVTHDGFFNSLFPLVDLAGRVTGACPGRKNLRPKTAGA